MAGPLVRPTLTLIDEVGVRDGTNDLFTLGNGEVTAVRKFKGLWAERLSITKYWLGHPEIEREAGTNAELRLRRLLPMAHPDHPKFYADRITVDHNQRPAGNRLNAGDLSTAQKHVFTYYNVHYMKPKFAVRSDDEVGETSEYLRWVERPRIRATVDFLNLKPGGGRLKKEGGLGADGHLVPYGVNVPMPLNRVTMVWRDLPADLFEEFPEGAGTTPWQKRIFGDIADPELILMPSTINVSTFGMWGPGTLLLQTVSMEPAPSPVDDPDWDIGARWDVTFEFLHRPTPGGHNWVYYADPVALSGKTGWYFYSRNDSFEAPGSVTDYNSLFNERDFLRLFKVQV